MRAAVEAELAKTEALLSSSPPLEPQHGPVKDALPAQVAWSRPQLPQPAGTLPHSDLFLASLAQAEARDVTLASKESVAHRTAADKLPPPAAQPQPAEAQPQPGFVSPDCVPSLPSKGQKGDGGG
eukprot:6873928-Prymnesium_polylepis.1